MAVQLQAGNHVGRVFSKQAVTLLAAFQGLLGEHLDQCERQRIGCIDLDLRPGHRFVVVGLDPGIEGSPWRDPQAVGIANHCLFRVAGPAQGAQDAGAEPDDEVVQLVIQRRHHHAAQRVIIDRQARPLQQLAQIIGMKHRRHRQLPQQADQTIKHRRRRHIAQQVTSPLDGDDGALGTDQAEQLFLEQHDDRIKLVRSPDQAGQFVKQVADAQTHRIALHGIHVDQFQGDHATDELVEFARTQADIARREMMAGDQPPQPVVLHQRNAQAGADSHVAQVFDMYRRHAAQPGMAEIDRLCRLLAINREQRHRLGIDVGNDAHQVFCVQGARLRRNVGSGKMVAEIRVGFLDLAFGNHFAVPVGIEAIHHDPVEAGQRTDLLDRHAGVLIEIVFRIQFPQCIANRDEQLVKDVAGRCLRLLHLDHEKIAGKKDLGIIGAQFAIDWQVDRPDLGPAPVTELDQGVQPVQLLGADQRGQRLANHPAGGRRKDTVQIRARRPNDE